MRLKRHGQRRAVAHRKNLANCDAEARFGDNLNQSGQKNPPETPADRYRRLNRRGVNPTCAESRVGFRQIKGLAEKSALQFWSSSWRSGAGDDCLLLMFGEADALRQDDA